MNTHLITITTSGIDHDMCHLVEHLVIQTFLPDHPQNTLFPGWVSATTTDEVIFFELGAFKGRKFIDDFHTHLKNIPQVSMDDIKPSIARIECEMRESIDVPRAPGFVRAVNDALRQLHTGHISIKNSPATLAVREDSFGDILIHVKACDLDDTSTKLFLWLRNLLLDLVESVGLRELPMYPVAQTISYMDEDDASINFGWRFSVKSAAAEKVCWQINAKLHARLHAYDIESTYATMKEYAAVLARSDRFPHLPIKFYQETGILTSADELLKICTRDRVEVILHKLTAEALVWDDPSDDFDWE